MRAHDGHKERDQLLARSLPLRRHRLQPLGSRLQPARLPLVPLIITPGQTLQVTACMPTTQCCVVIT